MTVYLSTKHATAKPSSKETVILVDPLSTGVLLEQRCFDAGYDVIIVWSDQSSPAARAKHLQNTGRTEDDFAAIIVHEEGRLDKTLLAILEVGANIKALMCGSNFGVLLEDELTKRSVGVTFCNSPMAVWTAFDTIMGGSYCDHCTAYKHYNNDGVLIQEFMEGTEYIVNLVCNEGVRKCTAMWKYDKRPYNGGSFVCFGKSLLSMEEDQRHREILDYTLRVLEAFCFMNGAIHAEVMYIEGRGPLLVEINCRLQGGNAAWVPPVEACMGYSQLSVLMDVYLNEGKILFDNIPSAPESIVGGCYAVKMRSNVCGILQDIIQSQLDRILALPSYQGHFFLVKPSDKLLLTVDMPSVPGEVTLVNEDRDILDQDYALLNEILDEGIFVAIPEGSPDEALVMSMINTDPIPVIMADAADTVSSAVDIINLTSDDINQS